MKTYLIVYNSIFSIHIAFTPILWAITADYAYIISLIEAIVKICKWIFQISAIYTNILERFSGIQLRDGDTILTLAIDAKSDGFDSPVTFQVLLYRLSKDSGALTMDNADRWQFGKQG